MRAPGSGQTDTQTDGQYENKGRLARIFFRFSEAGMRHETRGREPINNIQFTSTKMRWFSYYESDVGAWTVSGLPSLLNQPKCGEICSTCAFPCW